MTLADIREGLYYTLQEWGPYAASEISTCGFDVLEASNTCAIVFLPGADSTFDELAGGAESGVDYNNWSIEGGIYIKDTGDPKALLDRVWLAMDDFRSTLRKDRRLNLHADNAHMDSMSFDPNVAIEAGGQMWAEIRWKMIAEEFAND